MTTDILELERQGYTFFTRNQEELDRIVADVFEGREYFFDTKEGRPYIIDCGAHVGVSVAYFCHLYPQAEIVAFEPNPESFQLLEQMVARNGIEAKLVNKAVAGRGGVVDLLVSAEEVSPWSWGDSLVKNKWYSPESTRAISVEAVELSGYLDRRVDLLKLDVEGVETEVVEQIEPYLSQVQAIIVEFHGSLVNPNNQLERIIEMLAKAGFGYRLRQFGEVVELDKVVRDDPHWVVVAADRRTI